MNRRTNKSNRSARSLTAVAALALLGLPMVTTPAGAAAGAPAGAGRSAAATGPSVTVMTRNLYLGADIMRPIRAVQQVPAEPATTHQIRLVDALANATDVTRDIVDQTDFGVRSRLLAQELATQRPDLVGLQEVALWRSGPMDRADSAELLVPNATDVDYDFLAMLRTELRALGVPYRVVSVNRLSDVEAPAYQGSLLIPPVTQARDVRLTMRDVILKRKGSGMNVVRAKTRQFTAGLEIQIADKTLDFTRGYQWADVRSAAGRFRFINTHLEAFSSDIAFAQARELLERAGDSRRTTILVCDCNSDPVNGSVKEDIGDTQPHWAAYWLITNRYDFFDTWLQWRQPQRGWTSGLTERVDDPDASNFDHRIDMVFARTGDGQRLDVVRGSTTGNRVAAIDPATGLWPSDHAGVVMRLRGIR
jgi:endonuclease/exonuclease/phosphatase family metal-dependent hydrolase